MVYEYINDETMEAIEIELDPNEEIPSMIVLPENGKSYRRNWGAISTIIPEHMKAQGVSENRFNYEKKRTKTVF